MALVKICLGFEGYHRIFHKLDGNLIASCPSGGDWGN